MRSSRARDTGVVFASGAMQKVSAGLREVALAYGFGAGAATDTYLAGMALPGFLFSSMCAALTPALIPTWVRVREQQEGRLGVLSFFNTVVAATAVVAALLALLAPWLITRLYPGFSPAEVAITRRLMWLFLPGAVMSLVASFWAALAQAEGDFATPGLSPIPGNLLAAGLIGLLARRGILIAAVAAVAGQVLHLLFFWPRARRLLRGWRPTFSLNLGASGLQWAAPYALAATFMMQAGALADRFFASNIGPGSLSALNFGAQAATVPLSLLTGSVITVMVPRLSMSAAEGDRGALRQHVLETLSAALFLAMPLVLFFLVWRGEIVQLAFLRGAYTRSGVALTTRAFSGVAAGLFLFPVASLLTRLAYIEGRPQCAAIGIGAAVAAGSVLDALLAGPLGVLGLGLAGSAGQLVQAVTLWVLLSRQPHTALALTPLLRRLEPALWALVPGSVVLGTSRIVVLGPAGAVAGGASFVAVYLVASFFLGAREARWLGRLGARGMRRLLRLRTG